ncbi:regulatory signaling modulator protein AmpE [Thalassotalea agarivorans]|uniref:AmpE protein n=1 Tax=Thalassotalea agarivorans TaxID=349064 RepID=A0A1I0AZD0_THASX|nr:regulatory signaling modulator protein AmpE [Thalassotalea agarivorans]SES98999.1 AmpE protein [Thalassotalea agarivorans]
MSLISLLIAIAAERHLSQRWHFSSFYRLYLRTINKLGFSSPWANQSALALFILAPVALLALALYVLDNTVLDLLLSTLVLIVCFGCFTTRESYKQYLLSAFRGDLTAAELHHQELQKNKNEEETSFGHLLVWLNYRYYLAIMIFYVVFGAAGALFYRLLVTVSEGQTTAQYEDNQDAPTWAKRWLFYVDWLPARMVAFSYMLVGHFSKALTEFLEGFFAFTRQPKTILVNVAEKAEDFMLDPEDCTAEPCILVKLAKRAVLLWLTIVAVLILSGLLA